MFQEQNVTPFFYTTHDNTEVTVRTIRKDDGSIWFVAKDVCDVLGLADSTTATRSLEPEEKDTQTLRTPGGMQNMTVINESGLYTLIFRSSKPEAKRFRKWVTSEVLPSIRKTGSYSMNTSDENKPAPVKKEHVLKTVKKSRGIPQGIMKAAEKMFVRAGLDDFQITLALDKVFKEYTGESVLEMAGIRAVKHVDYETDMHEGIWTRKVTWSWEHDYPADKEEWGILGFDPETGAVFQLDNS